MKQTFGVATITEILAETGISNNGSFHEGKILFNSNRCSGDGRTLSYQAETDASQTQMKKYRRRKLLLLIGLKQIFVLSSLNF